jgi:hypothetical protein
MKWMQEDRNRGRDVDFVRSYRLSVAEYYFVRNSTYSNIDMGYIPNDIVLRVENRQRRHSFVVHHFECRCQRLVAAAVALARLLVL